MKVAIVQMSVKQADFAANLAKARALAERAKSGGADIAVFPEMFVCGFNYKANADFLAANPGAIMGGLSSIASDCGLWLCGTVPCPEADPARPSNRLALLDSQGKTRAAYDKIHLFSLFNENIHSSAGSRVEIAETPWGKLSFAICYDVRFPEMFAAMALAGAQCVILPAAWPHPRSEHWLTLARARAIENQMFVVAVNQCGSENFGSKQMKYCGLSRVFNPLGETLAECPADAPDAIAFAELDLPSCADARAKMPSLRDRRCDVYANYLRLDTPNPNR